MYPQIELELSIANRVVDFVEEGYDLAIRLGIPPDSRLIAHKLEEASVGIFGAPTYLAQRGIPQTLEDLEAHDCIQFVLPSTGRPMSWLFRDENGKDIEIVSRSRMRVHDDALGCISWARAGGGLFQTYHFIADAVVENGQHVEVLQGFGGRSRQFSILYPQNRHLSAKVRAFVDFLALAVKQRSLSGDVRVSRT